MNDSSNEPLSLPDEIDTSNRQTIKLSFAIAYLVLFIVGVIGNLIVIVMIANVLTSMRRSCRASLRRSQSSTSHVFIYVLGLSIVDLLVILHLPFLVVDLLKGSWLFGELMCKVYWFGESVNKLLSSFLMTVLSWDRYLAVCSPVTSMRIRSNSVAVAVLLASSTLAVLLLLPVLIQASVVKIDRIRMISLVDGSPELAVAEREGSLVAKCMFDADAVFVLYTFGTGFALPACFITIFYAQVIYRLHVSTKNMLSSRYGQKRSAGCRTAAAHRVQQVTKRIIAVIVFYFFCWTPQWTLNLMSQFGFIHPTWVTPALSSVFFCAHLLVCFNSAANPVLYALINRELRAQHLAALARRRQSMTAATQVALEFVARHTSNEGGRHCSLVSTGGGGPPLPHSSSNDSSSGCSSFLAGIKINVFNGGFKKRSEPPSPSKCSQFSAEPTHKDILRVSASSPFRDLKESPEDAFL